MRSIRTAVIGSGHLGTFHARKYWALPGSELVAVADVNEERLRALEVELGVAGTTDYRTLAGQVDAVSIAVPTSIHFEVGRFFLERGVHVLVEKPITNSVNEAQLLVDIAKRNGSVLQVGHLERFNAALLALGDILTVPQFIETHRLAPFKPRSTDINVVLDLMIHDIDIIQTLVRSPIRNVNTIGVPVLTAEEDIANARIEFETGCVANVTASRVSNRTERKMRIFQQDAYISVDYQERRLSVHRRVPPVRDNDMPQIHHEVQDFEEADALRVQIESFLGAIANGTRPVVTGEDGKRALETALRISAGLRPQMQQPAAPSA